MLHNTISKSNLRYLTLENNKIIFIDEYIGDQVKQVKTEVPLSNLKYALNNLSDELRPHIDILKTENNLSEIMVNNQVVFGNVKGKKGRNGVYKSAIDLGLDAVDAYERALINAIYSTVKVLKGVQNAG